MLLSVMASNNDKCWADFSSLTTTEYNVKYNRVINSTPWLEFLGLSGFNTTDNRAAENKSMLDTIDLEGLDDYRRPYYKITARQSRERISRFRHGTIDPNEVNNQ